ncbi:DNA mismatch repair endonuclease MutL [Filifactor alocis]|uniref:DNA mismatch repair endonuclease MutL n=1 Tax=Filifactor alocis TaxID=143361 RepID=UPI0028E5F2BA|nr:DNA mismatch repair endonuclease MutL [Filifactor alocis]
MGQEIFILDEFTIGKIAAGEVVERPSSVIKELVENSIDANAKNIVIEIKDGGKQYIRVSDDGVGIPHAELSKVFLRHSTSKIQKIEDLENLQTCGFRGEALSSICAVSKTTLMTKTSDEEWGSRVFVEGGKYISTEKIGLSQGTTLVIEDLFFNVPARKKFMKSSPAEAMAINQIVCRLAMGNPSIRFKLISNNKVIVSTVGDGTLENAIRSIYGKNAIEQMFYTKRNFEQEVTLYGYLSKTSMYQTNRRMQNFFFNRRYVEDISVARAMEDAYKGTIPIGKFPSCVLFIDLNPAQIDFNVHPNKLNVKYDSELRLEDKVYAFVRDALFQKSNHLIPKGSFVREEKTVEPPVKVQVPISVTEEKESGESQEVAVFSFEKKDATIPFEKILFPNESDTKEFESKVFEVRKEMSTEDVMMADEVQESENGYREVELYRVKNRAKESTVTESGKELSEPVIQNFLQTKEKEEDILNYEQLHYVGRVFSTYLIMTKEERMYLIDQHAAHERVLFERYMVLLHKDELSSQQLLNPILLELSYEDATLVEMYHDEIKKLGFDFDFLGEKVIVIRGVPVFFQETQGEQFMYEIIELLQENKNLENYEEFIDKVATKACRAAIKANDRIVDTEVEALLKDLNQCNNKYTCPHGRPVFIEVKKYDLEKMFKRVNA